MILKSRDARSEEVMAHLSPELEEALEAECGSSVDPLLASRKPSDLRALKSIVADDGESMSRRQSAIYLLGNWKDDEAVAIITDAVRQMDEVGKIAAASALGRMGTDPAIRALAELARDEALDVRRIAVNGLARSTADEASRALQAAASTDDSEMIRARAAAAMRRRSGG